MKWIKKWLRWTMILSFAALVVGCAGPSGNYCELARPIWWDSAQQLVATPMPITRQIVRHNETLRKICGNPD